ncbi:Uncharacterised protein [Slackia heliotrinireducens]|uniref:Uncharacterized protein n=1 Tax=Slackia heliotrinireducens (strain ATCC 29202 / DSM 20476 / NCTC 11029 / RHS 1) TaxID=471855 RepID=C7N5U0_SLAHD|nr:hypothetical protein [Slackia heliotrinireducens]ACV22275.1 hypothetical protein Shel_12470 [Slackia heliotrinireducens DSM 20476]VEH00449.1 Uncharacterised protein [Slackia heliotrinireducens]
MKPEEKKKNNEKDVLETALKLARKRGGESRRNIDRIMGTITCSESPDFIIECDKPFKGKHVTVAMEHFRVDHFSETNVKSGHQDSLAKIEQNRANKIQQSWKPESLEEDIPDDILQSVGYSLAKCIEARHKATYESYIKSFSNGLAKHASKLSNYDKNPHLTSSDSKPVKHSLLVELHSDFSDCLAHIGPNCRRPIPGELLIFDDMVDELNLLAGKVDYVLLVSYPALMGDAVDAVAIRPNCLKKGLARTKQRIIKYIGENETRSTYGREQVSSTVSVSGDSIKFLFECTNEGISIAEHITAVINMLPLAIKASKNGQSFVTTIAIQLFLDLFEGLLPDKRAITPHDIGWACSYLGKEEVDRRIKQFEKKWLQNRNQKQ